MRKSVPQNGKNKSIFIPQKIRVVGIKGRWGKGGGQSVPQNAKNKSIFISQKRRAVGIVCGKGNRSLEKLKIFGTKPNPSNGLGFDNCILY